MKTFSAKTAEVERQWWIVDAEGQTLGRLATRIATILRGKHKPIFTPHIDTGDFVIVINAEKIQVTGNKLDTIVYYRHSGYPGGLKERTLREQLQKFPERPIETAVKGMLPKNTLGRNMIKKLKVYAGSEHPHAAQQPQALEL
jgi:large subunit ribosomal protein L13